MFLFWGGLRFSVDIPTRNITPGDDFVMPNKLNHQLLFVYAKKGTLSSMDNTPQISANSVRRSYLGLRKSLTSQPLRIPPLNIRTLTANFQYRPPCPLDVL